MFKPKLRDIGVTGSERLRGDRLEHKAKKVFLADNFQDWISALDDPEVCLRFNELRECILNGRVVPLHFYRRSTNVDGLLIADGIKHLHLDGGGGDVLLFLVEYHDAVVFLEINSHKHFADCPPGSVLVTLHANCLRAQDRSAAERLNTRLLERRLIVLKGFKPRRPKRDEPEK